MAKKASKKNIEKKENKVFEKALFSQRFLAYLIDAVLIFLISAIAIFPVSNSESLEELTVQNTTIMNQYLEQEIDASTYMNQTMDISYEIAKQSGIATIITIFVYILYYVVFQFYHQGQTLGKRVMKIQVRAREKEELTLNQLLLRAAIANSILINTLILLFAIFASKDVYIGGSYIFTIIQYIVIFASVLMVMYRKDGCGVHDLIAHTEVVRCELKEKELEVCES